MNQRQHRLGDVDDEQFVPGASKQRRLVGDGQVGEGGDVPDPLDLTEEKTRRQLAVESRRRQRRQRRRRRRNVSRVDAAVTRRHDPVGITRCGAVTTIEWRELVAVVGRDGRLNDGAASGLNVKERGEEAVLAAGSVGRCRRTRRTSKGRRVEIARAMRRRKSAFLNC